MDNKIGISGYGISVPYRRLDTAEIIDCWQNTNIDLIKNKQGVRERGVLAFDEDGNTLAVEAGKRAMNMSKYNKIDAVIYGTCTNPYDSRPSSTMIAEALDIDYDAKVMDLQFSTKSGTSSVLVAYSLIKSGLAKSALAIGADTINRHTAPGDLFEPYASAGACALSIGFDDVIATLDDFESYSTDLGDGFRIEGERYIRSGMLPGSAKNDVGINIHTKNALENFLEKTGNKKDDFKHVILQQSTPGAAKSNAKKLGFSSGQIESSIFSETLGDTGSASTLIGLAKVLDIARSGDRIIVISYGFGAGSDVFSLTVTDKINHFGSRRGDVKKIIDNKTIVDYKTAMKLEYKYIRPEHMINAYL